jgi:hypothetical protein
MNYSGKLKELRQQWPGQYAVYVLVHTPSGKHIEIMTDVPEELANRITKQVTDHIKNTSVVISS